MINRQNFTLSIVVPIYNEADCLKQLLKNLIIACKSITNRFEIIVINDGSQDNTNEIIHTILPHQNIRYVELSRNFGKETALMAGIDRSIGDAIVLIDGDCQHPVGKLNEMMKFWQQGYDVIYGVPTSRKEESICKRFLVHIFYKLMTLGSSIDIPAHAGDFRWLDKKVIIALQQLPERARFMKGLYAWVGFRSIAFAFTPERRISGKSKFDFRKLSRLALVGWFSFSNFPIRLISILGFFLFLLGLFCCCYFIQQNVEWNANLAFFFSLFLVLSGIQLLCMGILGEYIGIILHESKKRPLYIVAEDTGSTLSISSEHLT